MRQYSNVIAAYSIMLILIILVGVFQSWAIALSIFNYCMISAVMTLGANIQWGYAGLINFGIMGYTALGGLAVVLVSVAPVPEAWRVGGLNMMTCLAIIIGMIFSIRYILKKIQKSKKRNYLIAAIIFFGLILIKLISGGNKYQASVTSLENERIVIMIQETYQHPTQIDITSFPVHKSSNPIKGSQIPSGIDFDDLDDVLVDRDPLEIHLEDDEYLEPDVAPEKTTSEVVSQDVIPDEDRLVQ